MEEWTPQEVKNFAEAAVIQLKMNNKKVMTTEFLMKEITIANKNKKEIQKLKKLQ